MKFNQKYKIPLIIAGVSASAVGGYFGYKALRGLQSKMFAQSFLGEEEKTGNLGFKNPEFEAMMKDVGWKVGQAWCAYFVKVIWMDKFGKKLPELDRLLSGSTQTTWNNFEKDTSGKFETGRTPHVGDIVVWSKVGTSFGHTGIVLKVGANDFETAEGNTNDKGGREGYIVAKKTRTYDFDKTSGLKLLGFIHIKKFN